MLEKNVAAVSGKANKDWIISCYNLETGDLLCSAELESSSEFKWSNSVDSQHWLSPIRKYFNL